MKVYLFFLSLLLFCHEAYANWPVVTPPSMQFLLDYNLIDTNTCPPNQGKIKTETSINIHKNFCKTFCPEDWFWTSLDNRCHDLSKFKFVGFQIAHERNDNGDITRSIVLANYGANTADVVAQFIFVTPSDQYWDCDVMNSELHTLSCANDIAFHKRKIT